MKRFLKSMRFKLFIILLYAALLGGCVTPQSGGTDSIAQLQHLSNSGTIQGGGHGVNVSQIRYTAIQDTALTLGAQSGLAWRARQINAITNSKATALDEAYNFYGMLLDHDVLPPVLAESDDTLNLDDPNTIRLSSKLYKIILQAHFVTAPPTWRDYLWLDYPNPEIPDRTLLPQNAAEQEVWNYYVAVGWKNGIQQANSIFAADLARLDRDYKGMALYRKLYAENMVSAPFVAKTDLGITGDGSQMSVNDQVLRITALPQLNLQGKSWKPGLIPTDSAGQQVATAPPSSPTRIVISNQPEGGTNN